MADPERVELAEARGIYDRAGRAGVPEVLAIQLRRAGGESRRPEEMLGLVGYLAFNHYTGWQRINGLANTDEELGRLLLEHYPAAVEAMVSDEAQRKVVISLWNEDQRPLIEAGVSPFSLAA